MKISSTNNYYPTVELDLIKAPQVSSQNSLIFTIFNSLLQKARNLLFTSRQSKILNTAHQLHFNNTPSITWSTKSYNEKFNFEDQKLADIKTIETIKPFKPISMKYTPIEHTQTKYNLLSFNPLKFLSIL